MRDYLNFRLFVSVFILIIYFIGLLLNELYKAGTEWVTIGTALITLSLFFSLVFLFQIRYAIGKIRTLVTDRAGAIINPVFGLLLSRWLYISFQADMYTFPILVTAILFFSMPFLGNWLYTGHGRYHSVYFYALFQVILVGVGTWLETAYFPQILKFLSL